MAVFQKFRKTVKSDASVAHVTTAVLTFNPYSMFCMTKRKTSFCTSLCSGLTRQFVWNLVSTCLYHWQIQITMLLSL